MMLRSFLSLLYLLFQYAEELQVDDLRKNYWKIVVLPSPWSCCSLCMEFEDGDGK